MASYQICHAKRLVTTSIDSTTKRVKRTGARVFDNLKDDILNISITRVNGNITTARQVGCNVCLHKHLQTTQRGNHVAINFEGKFDQIPFNIVSRRRSTRSNGGTIFLRCGSNIIRGIVPTRIRTDWTPRVSGVVCRSLDGASKHHVGRGSLVSTALEHVARTSITAIVRVRAVVVMAFAAFAPTLAHFALAHFEIASRVYFEQPIGPSRRNDAYEQQQQYKLPLLPRKREEDCPYYCHGCSVFDLDLEIKLVFSFLAHDQTKYALILR
jgi:hypothetical protein